LTDQPAHSYRLDKVIIMRLEKKVAVVTGSTRGIGEAVARTFHREGASVVISGRDETAGQNIVKDLTAQEKGLSDGGSDRAVFIKADVSSHEEVVRLMDETLTTFGAIDILVNNAGVVAPYPMEKLPMNAWNKVIDIDLKGVLLCSQIVGSEMIRRRSGAIINIASIAGRYAYPDGGAYGPAKAAVIMLTKQCAMEWSQYGIRVNAISPGLIRTPLSENIYQDEDITRRRVKMIPLGRIGRSEDVALAAVFLASDEASYITGQDLLVDGGLTDSVFQGIPGRSAIKEPM
jgi:NAD(P)-dependent dehydrogenase (short-subunit alcohol dehydrogenase family)